jgi:hypothetical protein
MKSAWLVPALAGIVLSSPAYAQITSTSNSGSSANSASNSTSNAAGGSATGGAAAASNAGNSQSASTVVTNSTPANQTIRTTPAIVAPALTTTLTETCMGSTSLGASVVGFGATGATTWNDSECVRRLNARELNAMGFHTEACYVLRVNKDVDNAFARSGNRCDNWVQPGAGAQGAATNPPWGSSHSSNGAPPAG